MSDSFRHLYKAAFAENATIAEGSNRLHFAAHSHHPWPDVTLDAQIQYWKDSQRMLDRKWDYLYSEVFPLARKNIADAIGVTNPEQIVFAPNTHEFVARIFSCLDFKKSVRVLTTDSEFYSFARQARRYAEMENVHVHKVPTLPFETFEARFIAEARKQNYDLVFFSHAFFNSGNVVKNVDAIIDACGSETTAIVIDGYHSFFAFPIQLSAQAQKRAFFLSGGYKYAQSGEGACFLYVPTQCELRPVYTGWFAEFAKLESEQKADLVQYASGGERFAGSTFDPSGFYRFNAVCEMYKTENLSVAKVHTYVMKLRAQFIQAWKEQPLFNLTEADMLNRQDDAHFITFKTNHALKLYKHLTDHHIWTDARADRLRFGFGLYQDQNTVGSLFEKMRSL